MLNYFNYVANKVLPNVFTDDLSVVEILGKVTLHLNDAIQQYNSLEERMNNKEITQDNDIVSKFNAQQIVINEYINLYNMLKTYVDNYFNVLDVQGEINGKLDLMVAMGVMDTIINNNLFAELNIKSQVNNIAYKESFATLQLLQSTYPNGNNYNHCVLADGFIYTYFNSTWISTQVQANGTGIANKTVLKKHLGFLAENTLNKFNLDTVTQGYKIISATGLLLEDVAFSTSDFINVNSSTLYKMNIVMWTVAFYDSNKTFISAITSGLSSFTTPSNCAYVRIAGTYANMINNFMLCENGIPLEYVPHYSLNKSNIVIDYADVKGLSTQLKDISNTLKNIIADKVNLFDILTVTQGYRIDSTGAMVVDVAFTVSDYISVLPNSLYLFNQTLWALAFYDANKIFISYVTSGLTSFTTPSNCAYIRLSGAYSVMSNNFMLCKDALPVTYVKPYVLRDNIIPYKGKKAMYLGDSITALTGTRGWTTYLNDILGVTSSINVSVSGCRWRDYVDSVYDGAPVFNGADGNLNNVIGNQVQKIINNNYSAPDFIIIACGTNDPYDSDFVSDVDYSLFSSTVALNTLDRKTIKGAMRYACETLMNLYPLAQIFITTPIQTTESMKPYSEVKQRGIKIMDIAERMSIPTIDTFKDCGIYSKYELNGLDGRDLIDGLHPNVSGAKKLGYCIARGVVNHYSFL